MYSFVKITFQCPRGIGIPYKNKKFGKLLIINPLKKELDSKVSNPIE
jgi:hypothetical protein